jgi:hypothetical protein
VSRDELDKRQPSELAQALSIDPSAPEMLSADELGATLRHLLETPISIDLGAEPAADVGDSVTFGQLLSEAQPQPELLQRAQRFAKACKSHPEGPLPPEVATVLYFAMIVKALLALGQRTSSLNDAELLAGVRWTLERAWIPTALRNLLEQGVARLESEIQSS